MTTPHTICGFPLIPQEFPWPGGLNLSRRCLPEGFLVSVYWCRSARGAMQRRKVAPTAESGGSQSGILPRRMIAALLLSGLANGSSGYNAENPGLRKSHQSRDDGRSGPGTKETEEIVWFYSSIMTLSMDGSLREVNIIRTRLI